MATAPLQEFGSQARPGSTPSCREPHSYAHSTPSPWRPAGTRSPADYSRRRPRFSCLTRRALGEATAPHRNGGEDSGPQNNSYTAPCSFYLDISPKRPYLNTWKDAQHHSPSGNYKSKPPVTLWCTHSPHAYQKQNKNQKIAKQTYPQNKTENEKYW